MSVSCSLSYAVSFAEEEDDSHRPGRNRVQIDALPRGSYGSKSARPPEPMTSAPAMYTGTAVLRFAYNAMIGAYTRSVSSCGGEELALKEKERTRTPKTRSAAPVSPFPVPR